MRTNASNFLYYALAICLFAFFGIPLLFAFITSLSTAQYTTAFFMLIIGFVPIYIGINIIKKQTTNPKYLIIAKIMQTHYELIAYDGIEDVYEDYSKTLSIENKLSLKKIESLSKDIRKSIITQVSNTQVIDESLSPSGFEKIMLTAKRLNVTMDNTTHWNLEVLVRCWEIENNDLPIIESNISLQKGEICYYTDRCKWMEQRMVTTAINYSNLSYSIKIAKGLHYRIGQIKPKRITESSLQLIDIGTFYLTNKRIIFMGSKKNANITYNKILAITPYTDGVGIEKDAGKSPVLICSQSSVVSRVLLRLNQNESAITNQ